MSYMVIYELFKRNIEIGFVEGGTEACTQS